MRSINSFAVFYTRYFKMKLHLKGNDKYYMYIVSLNPLFIRTLLLL